MRPYLTLLCLILTPVAASAAVEINEVAWMGSLTSANHEWIELYNTDTTSVLLDGWILSDGMNLEIPLSGTLLGNTYAVLERTSDDSAPGAAFLIYTGALVNTGATLTLRDTSGAIHNQVVGGEDWGELGGDNVTKETAQYTTRGWVTDTPTPGRVNNPGREEEDEEESPEEPVEDEEDETPPTVKPKRSSSNSTVRLETPNTTLTLTLDLQSVAYVNQTIPLTVTPKGIGKTIMNSLEYTWNFGDSYTASGQSVSHAYAYPGTYVVTVEAKYGRHAPVVRQEITILPTTLSLTRNQVFDLQLHNDAPYDVDVSGFLIKGTKTVVLPKHTIMPPRGTITIASERLEDLPGASLVGVYDTAKQLVTSTYSTLPKSLAVETPVKLVAKAETDVNLPPTAFAFTSPVSESVVLGGASARSATVTLANNLPASVIENKAATRAVATSEKSFPWPYIGLIALIATALLVLYKAPVQSTGEEKSI